MSCSTETEPPVVTVQEAAEMLVVSEKHIYNLNKAGLIPRPAGLGKCFRWARSEFLAWIDAGMPPRDRWEWQKRQAGTPSQSSHTAA